MGHIFSDIYDKLFKNKDITILMFGLDEAGKTTILYRINPEIDLPTIPNIGFGNEIFKYKGLNMNVLDIRGHVLISKNPWKSYFQNTKGIIFVVDSNDPGRLDEVRDILNSILEEAELKEAALLIYANKQDLPNALKPSELAARLHLSFPSSQRPWFIQETCAITGVGIFEGFDWLVQQINQRI